MTRDTLYEFLPPDLRIVLLAFQVEFSHFTGGNIVFVMKLDLTVSVYILRPK